jgi:hypothetical protein
MKINLQDIHKYLNSNKYDFKLFTIKYTENEKKTINNFILDKTKMYYHNGSINTIGKSINIFLSDLGNDQLQVNKMEKIIINLLYKILQTYKMSYFSLDIRVFVSKPNNHIPRWHKDSSFVNGVNTFKFVTTLKGPGTLFIKSTKEVNLIYNKINIDELDEKNKYPYDEKLDKKQLEYNLNEQYKIGNKYRSIYAKKFKHKKIIQSKNKGVIFFTGDDKDKSALHSEPKITEPRLFISILPKMKE